MALFAKLSWQLFSGASGIWCDILTARYGVSYMSTIMGGRVRCFRSASSWWRGVSLLEGNLDDSSDWFRDGLSLKVCFVLLTSFWEDSWVGNIPLHLKFPRIFFLFLIRAPNLWGRSGDGKGRVGYGISGGLFIFDYKLDFFSDL